MPAALRPNYQKEVAKFTEGSNPEVLSYTGIGAGKAFQTPPKTIIFDEAHRLRNPGTASTQAATELANQAENLLLLTGTPITNSPKDLAPLLSMLRKEKITPEQFEQNYIGHRKVYPTWLSRLTGRGVGEEAYVKNEANLREQLKGLIDYQPSKTPEGVNVNEETVRVPLSRGQARIQKAVRDKIPPEYAWKLDKEYPLTRDELSRMNSFLTGLRQSSLSTQPFRGDRDPLNAFDESSKLQKAFGDLQETLKTDPRKKALIYSNYIDAGLGPYAAALQRAKIPYGMYHGSMPVAERKKALQGYNEGTLKALLLGPAAAEGISTQGTSLIQLLDPHWHESRGRQAEGRGLRFDSHEGLPPELKNVAIKRYLSESQDPSFIMSLLGARRQRTGDEILERLAANKEQLNNQFRKILQEEGSSMNKQSSIPDFNSVQGLAKMAANEPLKVPNKMNVAKIDDATFTPKPQNFANTTQLLLPSGTYKTKPNVLAGETPKLPQLRGVNPLDAEMRRDYAANNLFARNYSPIPKYDGMPPKPVPLDVDYPITRAPARDQVYNQIGQHLYDNGKLNDYQGSLRQKFNTLAQQPRVDYDLSSKPVLREYSNVVPTKPAGLTLKNEILDPTKKLLSPTRPHMTLGTVPEIPLSYEENLTERGLTGKDLNSLQLDGKAVPSREITGKDLSRHTFDPGSVGLHELEHVNQTQAPERLRELDDLVSEARRNGKFDAGDFMSSRQGYRNRAPVERVTSDRFKYEFPATLGEVTHMTDSAEQATGQPVQGSMPITPSYDPSLNWMKNRAAEHGYLSGDKTMTELLNTPSGQAWLKQRMEESAPPVGKQYEEAVSNFTPKFGRKPYETWKQAPDYMREDTMKQSPAYQDYQQRYLQELPREQYNAAPSWGNWLRLQTGYPVQNKQGSAKKGDLMNKQAAQRMNVPIGIAYDPEMHAALIRWENAGSKRLSPALQRQVQANLGWTGKQTADDLDLVELLMEQEAAQTQNMKTADTIQTLAKMAADEHGLSLAEGGLLGAGLGTGLGYLKHRVGEYLSPSGSEYAPKLQALQKQLGKPGKDQTQVKQQIARIQEQQDAARRSSRNRNLLGGAAAGGSLGAYFTQRSRDQNEFRENTNRANRQRSADAQAKENYDKVLREKRDKAKQEADIKNSTLPSPARTSTPAERSRKWLEQDNTSTPSKTPEPVKVVEDEIKTLNEAELSPHRPYRDYNRYPPITMSPGIQAQAERAALREATSKARPELIDLLFGDGYAASRSSMNKARLFGRTFPEGTPESITDTFLDVVTDKDRKELRSAGVEKFLEDYRAEMNKKSSIQDLAKMAACGDACRCGQTENECTCSDVEKLARLVAKQAGVFMKNMKEPNPIEVRTTDRGFMPVAEHYREPRLLAKPFYNQRREFQNALELLAIMQPEVMDREQPNSNDASQFGITLAMRYPDRYRLPADARVELDGPELKKAPRQKKANSCSCGCDNENECTCSDVEKLARLVAKQASSGAWTRAEGKSESGGLNAKGRASLKAQGQNIKPPVTEAKPTGERAGRKSSFCARMGGMKKKLTSSETANDPDSRINKALRKWKC